MATFPPLLDELRRAPEYGRVKKYPRQPRKTASALIERFETVATVVASLPSLNIIKDDPANNRVLECALAGKASYIVTGDTHLLNLREYLGIVTLNPVGFLVLATSDSEG